MATTQNPQARPRQPEQQNRLMVGGVAVLGLAAIAVLAILGGQSSFEPTPAEQAAHHAVPARSGAPQVSVVRIDAGGNAVIAGRAAPGAKVTVSTNGMAIGSIAADTGGNFAFVTSRPLAPGDQEITLSSRLPGGAEHAPAHGIAVNVPAMPSEGPLAVLTGNGLTPSHLFGETPSEAPKTGPLAIGSVDYSGTGSAVIAGTAPPDSQVELLLGNVALGHTLSGADGRWKMHLQSVPRLSGEFHLKAFDPKMGNPKMGAAPASTASRQPVSSWRFHGQPHLEA